MTKILLVGCGRMGGALLDGWLDQGLTPSSIIIVEPGRIPVPDGALQISEAMELQRDFTPDVVMLAVKPQVMAEVLPPYCRFAATSLFLSIAAGRTIASFEKALGKDAAVVRAMPNTPAAVRRGITVASANRNVTASQRRIAGDLLSAVGAIDWVEDEGLIDAVTAVSGSGPAYVFYLVEAMAQAGISAGLSPDLAMKLARATVAGSGEMLHRSADPASRLRENVTSPGGTTAAALQVLMAKDGLAPLMEKAIAAAATRSRELAS